MSIFTKIERTKVGSNTFDLTHDRKLSTKFGQLTPVMLMDCVPGDSVTLKSNAMVRLAPMIAPVMHRVSAYIHFFFVPHRLIYEDWEDFITGGHDGEDVSLWPYFGLDLKNSSYNGVGSLNDYLGLPTDADVEAGSSTRKVSAMPHATYYKIWHDYYRDQNLQDAPELMLRSGDNTGNWNTYNNLRRRAWQHDYFTSALPWTQKGPEAMMPLGSSAPIYLDPSSAGDNQTVRDINHAEYPNAHLGSTGTNAYLNDDPADGGTGQGLILDLNGTHYADLSAATASSINDLRRAFKLQEWLEKNARGGSRYIESIAVHFGVQSSDKRLQRSEYIGGFSAPVKISEVLQTSNNDTQDTPQGNMAGHGVSFGSSGRLKYYAEEHGYIMGIMSVMPMSAYQQGIPKHFLRRDKFDYYWPEFAHIGEQGIENNELKVVGSAAQGQAIFGYTPRYSEYKFINSSVHGEFRTSFDFWHMGRKFGVGQPLLNENFITMKDEEVDRIFAVQDGSDHLWCHVLNEVKAKRKMPFFGSPKM